jgi:hypothetical protein
MLLKNFFKIVLQHPIFYSTLSFTAGVFITYLYIDLKEEHEIQKQEEQEEQEEQILFMKPCDYDSETCTNYTSEYDSETESDSYTSESD